MVRAREALLIFKCFSALGVNRNVDPTQSALYGGLRRFAGASCKYFKYRHVFKSLIECRWVLRICISSHLYECYYDDGAGT